MQPQQNSTTALNSHTNLYKKIHPQNGAPTIKLSPSEFYLFLVSVEVDEVEREDVVLGADQQSAPLLIQQESVVARAVGQAIEGDEVTGL